MTHQSSDSNITREVSTLEVVLHQFVKTIGIIRWPIAFVVCFGIIAETVPFLAGETTQLDIAFSWFTDFGEGLALKLSLLGNVCLGVLWRASHRTQRETIARLGQRNTKHELLIDQNRTSSGLAINGTTHPQDR